MLTIDDLRRRVDKSEIDTVLLTFTDMYGRQLGKRLDARFFLEGAAEPGTHACDYMLTTDMDMHPHKRALDCTPQQNNDQSFGRRRQSSDTHPPRALPQMGGGTREAR